MKGDSLGFKSWVKQIGGAPILAEVLGVSQHRVRTWLRSEATPHYDLMCAIKKISKNEVSVNDILAETHSGERRKCSKK